MLAWSGFWGAGIVAQAYRYRHVSGPVQRQQTNWVRLSLGLIFSVLALGFVLPSLFIDTANAWFAWAALATMPVILLFPVSVAVAILRHRLYDIDRLLSRTLTYGLLTVVLGILYAGTVVVLGQILNPQTGDSALAVAASTLLVAALLQPLRHVSRIWSTGASIGAAMTRPRPSRRLPPGSVSSWTPTRYRPRCWAWSTRRCSRRRRLCGFDLPRARPWTRAM